MTRFPIGTSYHSNLRGADLHAPSNEIVENSTGSTIQSLKCVRFNGMGPVYPRVELISDPLTQPIAGITAQIIENGKPGFMTALGFMYEIDTSAWAVNTLLYSDYGGNLTDVPIGFPVAIVMRQHSTNGAIYIDNTVGFTSNVISTAWQTSGNAGLNPVTHFFGTVDAVPIRFRTDDIQRMILDINGRLGIGTDTPGALLELKSHSSANATGLQTDTFYVETSSTSFETAVVVPIDDPSVVKIEFVATAREADGSNRASFKRSGVFYRQASNVQVQGGWQSDFTQKSNNSMGVDYTLGVGAVTFRVKAASSGETRWSGYTRVHRVF